MTGSAALLLLLLLLLELEPDVDDVADLEISISFCTEIRNESVSKMQAAGLPHQLAAWEASCGVASPHWGDTPTMFESTR